MAASRLIILGVAVAAAGAAGYVAKNMLTPPPAKVIVQKEPKQPKIELAEVLVLSSDVAMGAPVGDALSWESWPMGAVNESFITRQQEPDAREKYGQSLARVAMLAGEPLRKSKLIGEGRSFMSSILPSGKRAVATQISADTSAGGFILPNDFVDIIMVRRSDSAGASNGFLTETILQNIRVLAIDQTITEGEDGRRTKIGETATLELTVEQAEIITVAQQMADRLALSLRPVADAQQKPDRQADYLVSNGSGENGKERSVIRLIKSGEISTVGARK